MNIVIESQELSSFSIAICKVLSSIGHRIILWNQQQKSIYEMMSQLQPDIIIVSKNIKQNYWEILKDKKYIVHDCNDPFDKAITKITTTELIDLISYPNTFENYSLNTDVLFSTNYYDPKKDFLKLADKVFAETNLKIKCCGHKHSQNPYFIGLLETEDFTKVALSSKMVVTTDKIEKISLLNRKIYAVLPDEVDIENIFRICENEKIRKSNLKEERKNITTKNSVEFTADLLEAIGLNDDKNKALSMLGNIL